MTDKRANRSHPTVEEYPARSRARYLIGVLAATTFALTFALFVAAGLASSSAAAVTPRTHTPSIGRRFVVPPAVGVNLGGLDMHDGTILKSGTTFYMYGTEYKCGFTWGTAKTPFCGFAVRTAKSLGGPWSLPRLLFSPSAKVKTTGSNWALDNRQTWNWVCGLTGNGCFNPRMLRRPDGVWVLWFNAPVDTARHHVNAYWAMGCNGPIGPCGSSAGAPHGTDHKPTLTKCTTNGDFSIVTNGSSATILCSQRQLSEEQLNGSWTGGTGIGRHGISLPGVDTAEGVGAWQVSSHLWEMTYSNPQCGYCSGSPALLSAGGAVEVQTGYATAPTILGPWKALGVLSSGYCTGQPRTVFIVDGHAWEWIDQWAGSRNETGAAIELEPMAAKLWSC